MPEDEYDLAGFAVGVCDKKDMITGENLAAGDVLIGMASTGVHSNGFSLVRKVFDMTKDSLNTYYDELGATLGETLLAPTRIYVKSTPRHQRCRCNRKSMQPHHRRRLLREHSAYAQRQHRSRCTERQLHRTADLLI